MTYEMKDQSFSMFRNKKKEKETHPDWTGEMKINGEVYWVSAWDKSSEKAGAYFSGAIKKKDFTAAKKAASTDSAQRTEPAKKEEFADEMPW